MNFEPAANARSDQRRPLFITPEGVTVAGVTAAEMREVDRIAIEQTGPTLLQMMEHAGRSLADLVLGSIADEQSHASVVVLADLGIPAAAYRRAGIPVVRPFRRGFVVPITRI